ncbi:4942_t:CDS:2, partial [Scutellospora calospora]
MSTATATRSLFVCVLPPRDNHWSNIKKIQIFSLTIGDLAAEFPAEPEKGLRHYLVLAYNNQPSVLLLENIELFFPINSDNSLLSYNFRELLNNCLKEEVAILVIGTSNDIDSINPVVRSRFE